MKSFDGNVYNSGEEKNETDSVNNVSSEENTNDIYTENIQNIKKSDETDREEFAQKEPTDDAQTENLDEEKGSDEEEKSNDSQENKKSMSSEGPFEPEVEYASSYSPPHYVPNFTVVDGGNTAGHTKVKNAGGHSGKTVKTVLITAVICAMISFVVGAFAGFLGSFIGDDFRTIGYGDSEIEILKNDGSIKVNETVTSTGDKNLTVAELAAKVSNSVVEIEVMNAAGSGVIFSQSEAFGYIVTNYHVVEDNEDILVRLSGGDEYRAVYIDGDSFSDIAVLKISKKANEDFTVAVLGSSKNLCVGEAVVAIGNPLGTLGGTVTDGIISALDRQILVDNIPMTLLQHNAAINSGNSGGGLFNMAGELIGIVNAKKSAEGIEGLGFAIPIDLVSDAITEILEKGYISGRPTIGVTVAYGSPGLFMEQGVYIVSATNSDFKKYDRVISIDGKKISGVLDFYTALDDVEIGDTVNVIVEESNGNMRTVKATVEEYRPAGVS